METEYQHKLIIKSLHDAQAECSCGKWQYAFTGEKTKDEVTAEWERHAFVVCPKCGSTGLIEYTKEISRQQNVRIQIDDGNPNYDEACGVEGVDSDVAWYSCQGCGQDLQFYEDEHGRWVAEELDEYGLPKKGENKNDDTV